MVDHGFTHIALECTNLDSSIAFYAKYGEFEVVHRRDGVAWISDRTRPFAIVLAQTETVHPLAPFPHVGIACANREKFDALVEQAQVEGCLRSGPSVGSGPAGTWAFLDDPDGNTFEISIGQSVDVAVQDVNRITGPQRLQIIGVIGSGIDEHAKLSKPLGEAIARIGAHLLTGGGGGTMTSVARSFTHTHPRAGLSIGVLPSTDDGHFPVGYPNEFIEIPIATHLPLRGEEGAKPLSRNHINVRTPDMIVALPGGAGTNSEIELAIQCGTPMFLHESWESSWANDSTWSEVETVIHWIQNRN